MKVTPSQKNWLRIFAVLFGLTTIAMLAFAFSTYGNNVPIGFAFPAICTMFLAIASFSLSTTRTSKPSEPEPKNETPESEPQDETPEPEAQNGPQTAKPIWGKSLLHCRIEEIKFCRSNLKNLSLATEEEANKKLQQIKEEIKSGSITAECFHTRDPLPLNNYDFPLHLAITQRNWPPKARAKLIQLIIDHTTQFDLQGSFDMTPLMLAITYNMPSNIIIQLIEKSNCNKKDINGDTALMLLTEYNIEDNNINDSVFKALIAKTDFSIRGYLNNIALTYLMLGARDDRHKNMLLRRFNLLLNATDLTRHQNTLTQCFLKILSNDSRPPSNTQKEMLRIIARESPAFMTDELLTKIKEHDPQLHDEICQYKAQQLNLALILCTMRRRSNNPTNNTSTVIGEAADPSLPQELWHGILNEYCGGLPNQTPDHQEPAGPTPHNG